ncbi:hypothetical protein Sa4125_36860 [Aureimonas sp. SA4125]|uniref:hypothetical protein n=1 Tax=Aureimonas sp. SA4125 TaxID=2826993 RepID=UPI001CC376C7|nr:hypothetical protein [Aureimonas sp. SA4125]BDA86144.1 hypothetical protein Sa4125_36860 [Aureimonas sp. SA4125]
MTETSASTATRHAWPRSSKVIDGEAVVVAARQGVKSASAKAAAAPMAPPEAEPDARLSIRLAPAFERPQHPMARGAGPARRRPDLDLLFQPPQEFAPPTRASGLTLFLKDTGGSVPRNGRIAGLGALSLALLLPAVLFLFPEEAVGSAVAGVQAGGFRVAELSARIVPRGDAAVLSVEGRIQNSAAKAGFVPALRIALKSADGVTQTRMLAPGTKKLASGGALLFRSTVAVPAGSRGDVSVDFIGDVRIDAVGPSPR